MRRIGVKAKHILLVFVIALMLYPPLSVYAGGEQTNMAIGVRLGLNRLDGDIDSPPFQPMYYGTLTYNLFEYLAIGFEGGYSTIGGKVYWQMSDQAKKFKTIIIPYEAHLKFSFLPLGAVNPYVILGGGGFAWDYTIDGKTDTNQVTGEPKKGYDSFLKSGVGIEIALSKNKNWYFDLGATYRYSLTDMLDDVHSKLIGHKHPLNDAVFNIYGGFTYYFRTSKRGDQDHDWVPDELDLKVEIPEDPDGYLDHDGVPDDVPQISTMTTSLSGDSTADTKPPVVIHYPVHRVEQGTDINIKADIYENFRLKIASVIYRPVGTSGWKVGKLRKVAGVAYEGIIPGRYVQPGGLEYCVIAVDEAISGVGYCGLPKLPVRVEVLSHPKTWRIISGVAAFLGWGGAGYLMLKNQK